MRYLLCRSLESGTCLTYGPSGVTNGLINVAMQEIFEMARESDIDGSRTVGVITKCDMVADTTEVGET